MNKREISTIEVEYPEESEIKEQKALILERGMGKKQSFWERVRTIYMGPGLSVIFYQCGGTWLVGILVYLGVVLTGIPVLRMQGGCFFALLFFPLLYLVFSVVSYWGEEQDGLIELKQSVRYSFSYLISLRMLWASVASVVVNTGVCFVLMAGREEVWSVCAVGVSSTFLLSMLFVFLCYRGGKKRQILLVTGVWAVGCGLLVKCGEFWSNLLFRVVPVAVHVVVAVCCFIIYLKLIRKVERKNAYA